MERNPRNPRPPPREQRPAPPARRQRRGAKRYRAVKNKGARPLLSLKPKAKKRKGGKAITKQNKVVEMPSDIKPNSISYLLWKAQRNSIKVKKTKFTHDEIFKTN